MKFKNDFQFTSSSKVNYCVPKSTLEIVDKIISQNAKKHTTITYEKLMEEAKSKGANFMSRAFIPYILGEISKQYAIQSKPSVYPSSIVVRKDKRSVGDGFWKIDDGSKAPKRNTHLKIEEYQKDTFEYFSKN